MKNVLKILVFAPLFFVSCKKEAIITVYPGDTMNNEEAIALLEGAMARDANGLTAELVVATEVIKPLLTEGQTNSYCGISSDSTRMKPFNATRFEGNLSTYCKWLLNCEDQDAPESLVYSWDGNVRYESLRLITDDYTDGTLYLTNLEAGTEYLFNGNYERTGRQESKVRIGKSFESTVVFFLTDLAVGKDNDRINSGTATFTISGSASGGGPFYFSGDVVFLEDGAAGITLNGMIYSIKLY